MLDFKNKNVLITGGSRGIGLATATQFAKFGANVAFTYHQNEDAAKEVTHAIEVNGGKALALRAESYDEGALGPFVEKIIQEWGTLDVAVANAGIWNGAKIDQMTSQTFHETMEVNMTGSFVLAKIAAQQMKQQHSGSIVFISSTSGQRGESEHSHYAASKGAQISFTKSLAVELAPFGIRVNCVAPGWVYTDMTKNALDNSEVMVSLRHTVPLARPGQPEEIANAILFLAGPLASYITGEILNVNGGQVLCG